MADKPCGLILIVTGSTLRAEQLDRPLAYYLQSEIDKLGAGHEGRMALVLSDRYYLSHPQLHTLPVVSVGGPGLNLLARRLLKKLPAALAADGQFYIQMSLERPDLRASIWGMNNPQTRIAAVTFADRYLARFTQVCWEPKASPEA